MQALGLPFHGTKADIMHQLTARQLHQLIDLGGTKARSGATKVELFALLLQSLEEKNSRDDNFGKRIDQGDTETPNISGVVDKVEVSDESGAGTHSGVKASVETRARIVGENEMVAGAGASKVVSKAEAEPNEIEKADATQMAEDKAKEEAEAEAKEAKAHAKARKLAQCKINKHIESYCERGLQIEEVFLDIGPKGEKQVYVCPEKLSKSRTDASLTGL